MTQALPPVAQKIYIQCKKCDCERYHVVTAHTTASSAKVECEVCHAKSTYKLPSVARKAKAKAKTRISAKKVDRWEEVKGLIDNDAKQSYNMKMTFGMHATIEHPKFGVGIVTAIQGHAIEVTFEDGPRSLVHSRT